MRVSQKTDYALRALVEIARIPAGTNAVAGEVADRLGLPRRFVEQQITLLAKHGIVSCQRGPRGGCSLARPAGDITAAEVIRVVQGTVLDVPLAGGATAEMWASAAGDLEGGLELWSLERLAARQCEIDATPLYFI